MVNLALKGSAFFSVVALIPKFQIGLKHKTSSTNSANLQPKLPKHTQNSVIKD